MKYTFVINTIISMSIDIEANSLEDAVLEAKNSPTMGLCYHCAKGEEGCWCTSGELDGDPICAELADFYCDDKKHSLDDVRKVWNE